METFDPKAIALNVLGNVITGFMDGTFIEVERDEDTWALHVGADGEAARARNRNAAGKITFTLMQTSPSNDALSALATLDEQTGTAVGPAYVRDLLGTTLLGGDSAYVLKPAKVSYGAAAIEGRQWTVIVPKLDGVVGGALP